MRLINIGRASVKTTVGAVVTNVDHALALADKMSADNCTVGAFQEQLIGGYPAEDLVQWNHFVEAQREQLLRFAKHTAKSRTVFVLGLTVARNGHRYNAAAVVHGGRILGVVPKEKLPTYNVFYEWRTFSPGVPYMDEVLWDNVPFGDLLFRFDWGVMATEVCEDIWTPYGPMARRCFQGAELVVNVSASPFRIGVEGTRREMLQTRSGDNQCTLVYTNQVGGQDGLIFDGGGFIVQNGRLMHEAERFVEGCSMATVDLDRTLRLRAENTTWRTDAHDAGMRKLRVVTSEAPTADRSGLKYPVPKGQSFFLPIDCEEMLDALALGLGDYFEKCRFQQIGVALSGGRDSLLALLIAHRYLVKAGKPMTTLRTFYMPTRYSSEKTRNAAQAIARDLGVPFQVVDIEEAFQRELDAAKAMLGPAEAVTPVAEQNIQARIRGERMWNWANSVNGLFLQTGNMSEKAMGYTTIGGDLEGGLSVISNLPKTVVIFLLDYLARKTGYDGIKQVLSYPAGPELAANQEGEKELMPFILLDACFHLYAGEKLSPAEVKVALGSIFPALPKEQIEDNVNRFFKLFSQSIYKWVQAPLGLHVGNLDLDRERALQLPVVESPEWAMVKKD